MKVNVPELDRAADEVRRLRGEGVTVYFIPDRRLVAALELVGYGLLFLGGAILFAAHGSRVATKKGGRHAD